jgi:hypothetical protein
MEQLLSQLSVWGMAAMGFTTLRVTWSVLRAKSPNKLNRIFKIFLVKFFQFATTEYKALLMAIVSLLGFYWAESHIILQNSHSLVFGFTSVLLVGSIALSKFLSFNTRWENSFITKFFAHNAPISLAAVLAGSVGVGYLLLQQSFWSIFDLLMLFSNICLSASLVILSHRIWQYSTRETSRKFQETWLSVERQESLLASVVCGMFLGAIFQHQQNMENKALVSLPVWLCVFLIVFSVALNVLKSIRLLEKWQFLGNFIFKALFLVGCYFLVMSILPEFWIKNSKNFYALDVLYALLVGVLAGFFSDQTLKVYQFIQNKYTSYFLEKPKQHLILTYLIRILVMLLCLASIGGAMLLAYQYVGLYGLSMMLIGLLSNLNTQLSITPAKFS